MSLRDTLERLDKQGDLVRVRREADAKFEPLARAESFELAKIPGYEALDLRDHLA